MYIDERKQSLIKSKTGLQDIFKSKNNILFLYILIDNRKISKFQIILFELFLPITKEWSCNCRKQLLKENFYGIRIQNFPAVSQLLLLIYFTFCIMQK